MPYVECLYCGKKVYWANAAPKQYVCDVCEAKKIAEEAAEDDRAESEVWHDM
jgi:hypothetical protein